MAKKKEQKISDNPKDYGLDKMTLIELEEALEFSKKEENEHMVGLLNEQIKFKKRLEKKKAEISKSFSKMSAISDKIDFKQVKMKPQEWINMSPAFKETLRQPGIPMGHTSMVYGHSDVGKTTMAVELATFAQKQGVFPVLIITENKFSVERAEIMGLITETNYCHIHNDVDTIEEGCDIIDKYLKMQEAGEFPMDIVFIWDSIGQTQSDAERNAVEAGKGSGGMMSTARVIHQRIKRHICKKINASRKESYPYTNSLFFVNHAYTKPPTPPSTISSLAPYGGEGIWLAATFVIQMGGVTSRSSKVEATKDGVKVSFAIRSAIKLAKNHVNNVSARGKILCTDHGFIMDDKKVIDEYKASTRDDWSLEFDNDWEQVGLE